MQKFHYGEQADHVQDNFGLSNIWRKKALES